MPKKCARQGLHLHDLALASPSSWCVCQFRHARGGGGGRATACLCGRQPARNRQEPQMNTDKHRYEEGSGRLSDLVVVASIRVYLPSYLCSSVVPVRCLLPGAEAAVEGVLVALVKREDRFKRRARNLPDGLLVGVAVAMRDERTVQE